MVTHKTTFFTLVGLLALGNVHCSWSMQQPTLIQQLQETYAKYHQEKRQLILAADKKILHQKFLQEIKSMVNKQNINTSDAKGYTPLHWICSTSKTDLTYHFLKLGAKINQPFKGNRRGTPLAIACLHRQLAQVQLLVSKGAIYDDVFVKNIEDLDQKHHDLKDIVSYLREHHVQAPKNDPMKPVVLEKITNAWREIYKKDNTKKIVKKRKKSKQSFRFAGNLCTIKMISPRQENEHQR
jgi:DNA topoisomerase VI subunit B